MSLAVILCCALENEASLAPVVEALRGEGGSPEVIPGVNEDLLALGRALDRNEGGGLYVLCEGGSLTRSDVRKLEGVFSARKGPAHHLMVARFEPERPMRLLPPIRDALKNGGRPTAPMRRPSQPSLPAGAGQRAASKIDPRQAEALARELQGHMEAAERALDRSAGSTKPQPPPPPPDARRSPPPKVAATRRSPAPAPEKRQVSGWAFVALGAMALGGGLAWYFGFGPGSQTSPMARGLEVRAGADANEAVVPELPEDAVAPPTLQDSGPEPEPEAEAESALPTAGADGSLVERQDVVVARAVAKGLVRTLDNLVWAPGRVDKGVSFAESSRVCDEMIQGGVTEFRLPTAKELRALRRARMLDGGTYWTTTPAEGAHGKLQVLDTSEVALGMLDRATGEARAICVRARR